MDSPGPQARGRPRDPALEQRVYDQAIALYAHAGWVGFTFDAVARAAGVGKEALYRRWTSRGDLLSKTLQARWHMIGDIDTGTIATDLMMLARLYHDAMTGPLGRVTLHLYADGELFAEFRDEISPYGEPAKRQARMMIRRAIDRGELPATTDPTLILDLVIGAITSRVAAVPDALKARMLAKRDMFLQDLVDIVLAGAATRGAR